MTPSLSIRHANSLDVPALARLRGHYVLHTHSTFDTAPPTHDEVSAWLTGFSPHTAHQLLLAVDGEELWGYASTSPYRPKPAFARTAELSAYLSPDVQGRGVGSALYSELMRSTPQYGVRTFVAGVALPNHSSIAFHRKRGFLEVGTFSDYAEKWGRPISSTWFQRHADPAAPRH